MLIQALLDAPMFATRWRWVAGVALALPRFRGGRKVPPQLARMEAEDLIAAVFPDQLACAENLVGEREIPDHPLVNQTIADCLHEAMDIDGLERLLARLEAGEIRVVARDLTAALAARAGGAVGAALRLSRRRAAGGAPHAGGDGRRWLTPETASELGRLDPEAIARVRAEAWPDPANADELHDALVWLGFLTAEEAAARAGLERLARQRSAQRAVGCTLLHGPRRRCGSPPSGCRSSRRCGPKRDSSRRSPRPPPMPAAMWSRDEALVEILRGRLEGLGPVTQAALAAPLGLEPSDIAAALMALEAEGFAMRGRFTPGSERGGVVRPAPARAHPPLHGQAAARRDRAGRRARLPALPVRLAARAPETRHGRAGRARRGPRPARRLRGAGGAWETEILPARIAGYEPAWLDDQCLAGRIAWARLAPVRRQGRTALSAARPRCARRRSPCLRAATRRSGRRCPATAELAAAEPSGAGGADYIREHGASFFDELADGHRPAAPAGRGGARRAGGARPGRRRTASAGLRALLVPSDRRKPAAGGRRRRRVDRLRHGRRRPLGAGAASRRCDEWREAEAEAVEHVARTLLRRYGVVFWRLLRARGGWLPPWRDLLRVYRRLEARGEIRGGRFVAGFSGEQFALARRDRSAARDAAPAQDRRVGVAVRRRSAQPCRHPDAGAEAPRADRQPRALPGRPSDRLARRRRYNVP